MKNHAQDVVEKLFPDPFLINKNWACLWINIIKFHTVFFNLWQLKDHRNILNLSCRPFAFTSYKTFLKNKKWSGTSLPASFSAWFLKKHFPGYFLLPDQISSANQIWSNFIAFTLWDIEQYVYYNCLLCVL